MISFFEAVQSLFNYSNTEDDFEVGSKYRIYFYLKQEGREDIDGTQVELIGQSKQTVKFILTKNLRKKYSSPILTLNDYPCLGIFKMWMIMQYFVTKWVEVISNVLLEGDYGQLNHGTASRFRFNPVEMPKINV